MPKNIALIFPNQLVEIKYLPYDYQKIDLFIIIEDSLFFLDKTRKLKFNLLKLIYQRACMKFYEDYLISNKLKVKYINWSENNDWMDFDIINESNLHFIDPVDRLLENRIEKKFINYCIYESPLFLNTIDDLDDYVKTMKSDKFRNQHFYIYHRKRDNILMENNKPIGNKYSFDSQNRKPFPKKSFNNFIYENSIKINTKKYKSEFYDESIKYCEKTFKNHYKSNYNSENVYLYPITFQDSKNHFNNFVKNKIEYFGDYQDAISFDNPFLFHSVISIQLNNGLLNPKWVINRLIKYYEYYGNLIDIEAFYRQLIWREYSRLLYIYAYDRMKQNFFNHQNKLSKKFYEGTTGIEPVDLCIKIAFNYGYLHHILRLMILCNIMNLLHINPNDVYKWFMEFSLDSYDWVMINNVYSMGLYADGGVSTTKPYITSSNYVKKQSGLKGDWENDWNVLYKFFLHKFRNKLSGRIILHSKKTKLSKSEIHQANSVIKKILF